MAVYVLYVTASAQWWVRSGRIAKNRLVFGIGIGIGIGIGGADRVAGQVRCSQISWFPCQGQMMALRLFEHVSGETHA